MMLAVTTEQQQQQQPPTMGSKKTKRRRRHRRDRVHVDDALFRVNFNRDPVRYFQSPDELDRVFSEPCLVTLNLSDLVPTENRCVRLRNGENDRCGGITLVADQLEEVEKEDDDVSVGDYQGNCVGVDVATNDRAIKCRRANKRLKRHWGRTSVDREDYDNYAAAADDDDDDDEGIEVFKLRCVLELWRRLSDDEPIGSILYSGNRLRDDRRDVLSMLSAFRFSSTIDPRLQANLETRFLSYREHVDELLLFTHMDQCLSTDHTGCDISWPYEVSLNTVSDIQHGSVQFLLKFRNDGDVTQLRVCSQNLWRSLRHCWLAELSLSQAFLDYAKRLYGRIKLQTHQMQRMPGISTNVFPGYALQLYRLMFVRTYESVRQISVNLDRLQQEYLLQQVLVSSAATTADDVRPTLQLPENDDNGGGGDDDDDHESLDRALESRDDNRTQQQIRDFLLGYEAFFVVPGQSMRSSPSKWASRVDLLSDTDCAELIELGDTVLNIYRACKMLYYDQRTPRVERFVASVVRALTESWSALTNDAATSIIMRGQNVARDMLSRRKSEPSSSSSPSETTTTTATSFLELEFLVRQISGNVLPDDCSIVDHNVRRRQTNRNVDADLVMQQMECDVIRMNDQNFQLNERHWHDLENWVFAAQDPYKFTYPYAVISRLNDFAMRRKVRESISLYTQLLRAKFYRLAFQRIKRPALENFPTGNHADDPFDEFRDTTASINLCAMYDEVARTMQVRASRNQAIQQTLVALRKILDSVPLNG